MPTVLTEWQLQPSVMIGVVAADVLYVAGWRYSLRRGIARRLHWWQPIVFTVALLAVVIALESPLDTLADQFLWAHMIQHELLILVAAPLLLLAAPLWPLWRGIPLPVRRATLIWLIRWRWPRRLGQTIAGWLSAPRVALLLFVGIFLVWHIPALYDLALEHEGVHVLEHMLFLAAALVFWAQVIPSYPLHPHLSYPLRAVYLAAAALPLNVLGALYVFSTGPIYPFYAALPHAAGVLTVLEDQHFAGAAMDVPETVVFFVAIVAMLGFWLQEDEQAGEITTITPAVRSRA